MINKERFFKTSKNFGERFDLIQSAGGNISFKYKNLMIIKASGYSLSDLGDDNSYSIINNKILSKLFNNYLDDYTLIENKAKILLNKSIINRNSKPSIETFFHSFLLKYTIHTHPISVNCIACDKNFATIIKQLFPKCIVIAYFTPGLILSLEIFKNYINKDKVTIIFLQNHGLIVSANNLNLAIKKHDEVILKINKYLNFDNKLFKLANDISNCINKFFKINNTTYLSEDYTIMKYISKQNVYYKPLTPDIFVFCGYEIIQIKKVADLKYCLIKYYNKYNSKPALILLNNNLYINAKNLNLARNIESIFKSFILINNFIKKPNELDNSELNYLENWDAEKYRKNKL